MHTPTREQARENAQTLAARLGTSREEAADDEGGGGGGGEGLKEEAGEEAKAAVAAAAVTHLAASEAGNVESRTVSSTVLLHTNDPTPA